MMRFIATFGFIGLIPVAPGTFGSLAALPFAWILHWIGGFPALVIATIAVFAIGLWATTELSAIPGADPDPSGIVF